MSTEAGDLARPRHRRPPYLLQHRRQKNWPWEDVRPLWAIGDARDLERQCARDGTWCRVLTREGVEVFNTEQLDI